MKAAGTARTQRAQTGSRQASRATGGHYRWRFLRHYLGVIPGDNLILLEHLAMFPLMFLVMLRRRAEYGGSSQG